MGDFIKELDIVDFLGMLLPGSFLILLFSMDYPVDMFFMNYFGKNIDGAIKAVLLIVTGYFAGMLIHEVGDMLERIVYRTKYFNPKFYAAKVVGYKKIEEALSNSGYNKFSDTSFTQWKNKKRLKSFLSLLVWVVIFSFAFAVCFISPENSQMFFQYMIIFLAVTMLAVLIFTKIFNKLYSGSVPCSDSIHEGILEMNSTLQCIMFDKGTMSKRRVFDGFHVMMRNIVLVIAVIQLYVYFVRLESGQLYNFLNMIYNSSWMRISVFVLIVLMMIRWFHYVYLKYKYLYEDFLMYTEEIKKKAAASTAESSGNSGNAVNP